MSRYIVEVEDKDAARFEALLLQNGFAPAADASSPQVPAWQKEHVRRILRETPQSSYLSLEEAQAQWEDESLAG